MGREDNLTKFDHLCVAKKPKNMKTDPKQVKTECLQRYKGLLGFGFSQFISYAKLHLKTQKLLIFNKNIARIANAVTITLYSRVTM